MRLPRTWRNAGLLAALVSLALLSLGACGPVPPYSAPGRPIIRATPQPNGCPVTRVPESWPDPEVVVTGPGTPPGEPTLTPGGARLVSVAHGQRVDFRLASSYKWVVSRAPSSTILQPAVPAGWYDAGPEACIWGYTAVAAGTTEIDFVGSPVCAPAQACPAIAVLARYEVVVG